MIVIWSWVWGGISFSSRHSFRSPFKMFPSSWSGQQERKCLAFPMPGMVRAKGTMGWSGERPVLHSFWGEKPKANRYNSLLMAHDQKEVSSSFKMKITFLNQQWLVDFSRDAFWSVVGHHRLGALHGDVFSGPRHRAPSRPPVALSPRSSASFLPWFHVITRAPVQLFFLLYADSSMVSTQLENT